MQKSLRELENSHVVYGWRKQGHAADALIERAEGVYMWDASGKRYMDFCSGQINVNLGYGHPKVAQAIARQAAKTSYVAPMFATEARIRLATMVAQRAPGDLQFVFFTNSGSESVENAIKIARAVTGRSKIYSAWQSYHGATAGASAISGDPRRLYVEPAMSGLGKFHFPNCYRCPLGQTGPPECRFACLQSLANQLLHEGPETVAAIVMEPIVGTSGLYIPPPEFVRGVRKLCDDYGIVLVFDETMSGWGRTGRWFACEHFDVVPDILVTAKGITSGYVPLGATVLRPHIRDQFLMRDFVGGLTNEAHPLACAAAIAVLEAYEQEQLIQRSETLGYHLATRLLELKHKHPSVGDVRSKGLFACIELTRDRASKAPLAGHRNALRNVSTELSRRLFEAGLIVIAKWDFVFIAPALSISKNELDEGLEKIDQALAFTDELVAELSC